MNTEQGIPLDQLSEFSLPVYASRGVMQQAHALATRFEQAHRFLTRTFAITPMIQLAVLSREDWPRYTQSPLYGATLYDYPHRTVVTGGEPAVFWRPLLDLIHTHAPDHFQALRTLYPSATEEIDLTPHVDLWILHDLGHACHLHHAYWFPRKWLMEFFATLCLYSYLACHEPEQLALATNFLFAMHELPAQLFAHRTLPAFESLYIQMPLENYLWFAGHFMQQAQAVYTQMGSAALSRFWEVFVLANVHDVSDDELASIFMNALPEIASILLAPP